MAKRKQTILWTCAHCGYAHTWTWHEAAPKSMLKGPFNMVCDKCHAKTDVDMVPDKDTPGTYRCT